MLPNSGVKKNMQTFNICSVFQLISNDVNSFYVAATFWTSLSVPLVSGTTQPICLSAALEP